MCMYWTLRKYSHQHRRKAVAKYFRRRSITRNWIFSDIHAEDGKKEVIFINKMMDIRIQRHVKIRSDVHPFTPRDWDYFANRKLWKMSVRDRQKKAYRRIYAQMQSNIAGRSTA